MANILDELMDFLAAAGVVDGGVPPPEGPGNVFATSRPEVPDRAVVLKLTPGLEPRRTLGDNPPVSHRPRVQLTARDRLDVDALDLAWDAWRALEDVVDADLGGTRYVRIECLQDPFFLHRDDANRFVYAFNIQVERDVVA